MAVPIGERKMADSPAAIPIKTKNRLSRSGRWNKLAYIEPKPAAISAAGPSRPADPPEPIVMAEATIFTGATRARIFPPVQ
jgi:hypothetical protein